MAILGQEHPNAETEQQLYVVPTDSKLVIQLFHVCDTNDIHPNTDKETIRVWILPSGTSATSEEYLVLNWYEIGFNQKLDMLQDVQLRDGDQIVVLSKYGRVTFSLFGNQEYDADSDIRTRKSEVAAGTFTHAEELALLTGGGYNINNCNCGGV